MAKWTSLGHAMRRRMGAPSNHLESAGSPMKSRTNPTSDEAAYALAANGSPRIPMGMSAYYVDPAPVLEGSLIPKKNVQAGDPVNPGSKANHANVLYNERLGASYVVKAMYAPTIDPAAGATMANARIVPSVQGRNFGGGMQDGMI